MILIDLLQAGGYRFKQATLRKMQTAYFEILKAFVKHLDMPDVGNFIISGCTVVGDNLTSGMMYIDGELCEFAETPGTADSLIKKNVAYTNLVFKSGGNLPVFRATNAIVVEADGVALSDFVRIQTVKELIWGNIGGIPADIVYDADYVHTEQNFTTILKNKLNSLSFPDWSVTNPANPGYIANKPVGNIMTYLHKGTLAFDDVDGTNDSFIVTIPDVGTTSYMVIYTINSHGTPGFDTNCFFAIRNKTATSFTLIAQELASEIQHLSMDYVLIPL